jgi:hypothetical protein
MNRIAQQPLFSRAFGRSADLRAPFLRTIKRDSDHGTTIENIGFE